MRSADLYTGAAQIRDAYEDLQLAWQAAAETWHDGVSEAFCQQRLEPLGPVLKTGLDSLQRMLHISEQMHRDLDA